MVCIIREIQKKDNLEIEKIIRSCLREFGADHEGTAWSDPNLGRFSEIYCTEEDKYWVAENEYGTIVGGAGIGKLEDGICELQKMYCLPEVRGTGVAHQLMEKALKHASKYYCKCYLETLENMKAAQKFYEKYGFIRIQKPLVETAHYACEVRYLKKFNKKESG